MNRTYSRVSTKKIGRSVFDLSHEFKFTCDMGELIPILALDCIPGDIFNMGCQMVIRFQPLVAPILHKINAKIYYFFEPYRLLWHDDTPETGSWESFITMGEDGDEEPTLPTWDSGGNNAVGDLWDYLGYPTGITPGAGGKPVAFPQYAYNDIWNHYYRDENLQDEVNLDDEALLSVNWEKDRYTSALPWQTRGTPPALALSGVFDVDPKNDTITMKNTADATERILQFEQTTGEISGGTAPSATANARWVDPALEVDASNITAFGMAELRLTAQVQRWMEANARGGVRYNEFLKMHHNVAPRDERLQRPEYIGGMKMPVIFSEVLQTESSDATTPQGHMSGHGIGVAGKHIGKYRVQEYGIIMALLSVTPNTAYSQGIDKQWLKEDPYDYVFPEFVNLPEVALTHAELYTSATPADNTSIFGYQGRYNEYRAMESRIAGDLRSTYDYWHLGRQFGSKPSLNTTFITCSPRKDIFAAPSVDGLIVNIGHKITAIRPLPVEPIPGFLDH